MIRRPALTSSVRAMETQISELEAEASHLLRALDVVKESRSDLERMERRRADEGARERSTLVSGTGLMMSQAHTSDSRVR